MTKHRVGFLQVIGVAACLLASRSQAAEVIASGRSTTPGVGATTLVDMAGQFGIPPTQPYVVLVRFTGSAGRVDYARTVECRTHFDSSPTIGPCYVQMDPGTAVTLEVHNVTKTLIGVAP